MRIAFNIALILSILFLPWWTGAIILVSACFLVDRFYEAMFYGVLADALYGSSLGIHGFAYAASAFAFSVFALSYFIKGKIVW